MKRWILTAWVLAVMTIGMSVPALAQSSSASAYGVLQYTLVDLKPTDAISPGVTFLNGPFSEGYTVNNYSVRAAATNVIGYPFNTEPGLHLFGSTDGTVMTVSGAQSFQMATGAGALRIANNVARKLVTVSGQATAGGGDLGSEWDGQGSAAFAQAFELTPYTSIIFTFTPELAAIVDGVMNAQSPNASAGAISMAQLGTGVRQANGTYAMSWISGLAQLDTSTEVAGWKGGAMFYDSRLLRFVENTTATSIYGAVDASVWTESFFHNPDSGVGLAMMPLAAVPEPGTLAMMLAGMFALVGKQRRLMARSTLYGGCVK